MGPPLAARAARIAVPAAVITALGVGVAGAVMPGDDAQVAYPAPASTASVESAPIETTARAQELSRGNARPRIEVASEPKPKSSASETIAPILSLKITDRKYATSGLNVRTEPRNGASVVAVVHKGTKLAVTKIITNGFRYVSYHGKGRWVKNKYLSDTKPKATSSSSNGGAVAVEYQELPAQEGPRSSLVSPLTPSASTARSAIATPSSRASLAAGALVVTTGPAVLSTA